MSTREILRRILHRLEICFDWVKFRIKRRFGLFDPVHIFPYRGFGNRQRAQLLGRVLEAKEIGQANRNDPWWRNALSIARRFMTDEIPGIRVRGTCLGQTCEATTDSEGYFQLQFNFAERHSTADRWPQVDLELLDTVTPDDRLLGVGEILIPPEDAQFGVISDIDDTILQSSATDLWRLAWLTFSNNAYTRTPFPRVASFYQALEAGSQGRGPNPIFYVSSSAWNLYDLLAQFMELQQIPRGPILLRDLGLDDKKFIASGHDHKLEKIDQIVGYYPGLPFVLIGDSGQRDPWLYREAVRQHPGRVAAIYIRNVGRNRQKVDAIRRELATAQVEMLLIDDALEAARHACAAGLITRESLQQIEQSGSSPAENARNRRQRSTA